MTCVPFIFPELVGFFVCLFKDTLSHSSLIDVFLLNDKHGGDNNNDLGSYFAY